MTKHDETKMNRPKRPGARKATIPLLLVAMLALPASTGIPGELWATSAVLNESSWEYGENAEGHTVWATGIDSLPNRPECSYIESQPIPGSLFVSDLGFPTFELRHSFEMYAERSSGAGYYAGDAGTVHISKDGGDTWELLQMTDYVTTAAVWDFSIGGISSAPACFRSLPGDLDWENNNDRGYYTRAGTEWVSLANAGPILPSDTVVIRLAFWSLYNETLRGADPDLDGWEIQSLKLGSLDLEGLLDDLPLPR